MHRVSHSTLKHDGKPDCSPTFIALENFREEAKRLMEPVWINTDRKQKKYAKRETNRHFNTGIRTSNTQESVADTATQRGGKNFDNIRKLLDYLGEKMHGSQMQLD